MILHLCEFTPSAINLVLGRGIRRGARGARVLSILGTTKTTVFSTNAQSKLASVVLDVSNLCPPSLARHSWQLLDVCVASYLWRFRSNAHSSRLRDLERRCVSSKSTSRVQDGQERVARRDRKEKCFTDEASLIYPPGKSMIFLPIWPPNIWLLWTSLRSNRHWEGGNNGELQRFDIQICLNLTRVVGGWIWRRQREMISCCERTCVFADLYAAAKEILLLL